jgi:hypothetical protein
MVNVVRIRELRNAMRACLPWGPGVPITDEMLSACVAMLSEVWTLRIWFSPEKHVSEKTSVDLMRRISGELSKLMQAQASELLPHATTFTMFNTGDSPESEEI